jgi:AcrR family transcriptional regulator
MGRTAYTEEEIQQARRMLIDGAMSLYMEGGLDSVSLRQVADRIGMSHTLVYRYFNDKNALLAELRMDCLDELEQALHNADDPAAAPLERLRRALGTMMTFGHDEPAKYRLVFAHEQPHLDDFPRLRARREKVFAVCLEIVSAAVRAKGLGVDPLLYTHGFWSLIHGMLSLHTAGQLVHGVALERMASPLLEILLRPLTDDSSAPSARR